MSNIPESAARLINTITGIRDSRAQLQQDRYNILTDNYDDFLERALTEQFRTDTRVVSEIKRYIDKSANVYKYIIRLLSVVYKESPHRKFVNQQDTILYNEVVDVNDLDAAMEQVNRITTACNECFVRPIVRDNQVDIDIIPPHKAEVISDGPRLKAIIFPVTHENETLYQYLDDTYSIIFDADRNALPAYATTHKYGRVPIITYRRARPVDGFWLGTDGEDLVHCFLTQTISRSWINRTGYMQSYSQVYREQDEGIGDEIGMVQGTPTFGPGSIPVGKFRTLDLKTDLSKQLDCIERKLQRTASNWGISADALNQMNHTSGIERLLSFSTLLEHRLQTIKHYRPVDKKFMKLVCTIWNTDGRGKKFSSTPVPQIDYAEPRLIESRLDEITLHEKEVSAGTSSPVDYIMRRNPDLILRSEAMKIVKRNLDEGQIVQEYRKSFQVAENQDLDQKQIEGAMGGRPERTDPKEITQEIEK